MVPDPLHPAIVHFPIVLAFLLPIFALVALWAIRRGAPPLRAWAFPLVLATALTASGWAALETGEAESERVEGAVAESVIHEHEEAAERFLVVSGLVLLVAGLGLVGGTLGTAARLVATAGSVAVLAAGVSVGAAGGDLVYRHGAAQPYVTAATGNVGAPAARVRHHDDD